MKSTRHCLEEPRRRPLLLAPLALCLGPSAAWGRTAGSGNFKSESRPTGEFDAIAVSGTIDLVVRQGAKEALELVADDNLLPLVETVIESGSQGRTLKIRLRRGESISGRHTIKATVDVVRLQGLASAGSGSVRVMGALKTPSLRLSLSGSGDARLDALGADTLEVRIAGSGNVQAAGTTGQLKVSISGSGDVDLLPLAADDVTVRIAGSGDAKVTANKSLSVSIAGSGDVVYSGAVTDVRRSVAGSGRISKR